jgi:hypothetical protein
MLALDFGCSRCPEISCESAEICVTKSDSKSASYEFRTESAQSGALEKNRSRDRISGHGRGGAVRRFARERPCLLGISARSQVGGECCARIDWRRETNCIPTFSKSAGLWKPPRSVQLPSVGSNPPTLTMQSAANRSPHQISLLTGEFSRKRRCIPIKARLREKPAIESNLAERCYPDPGQAVQPVLTSVIVSSMIARMVRTQRPHCGLQPRQP